MLVAESSRAYQLQAAGGVGMDKVESGAYAGVDRVWLQRRKAWYVANWVGGRCWEGDSSAVEGSNDAGIWNNDNVPTKRTMIGTCDGVLENDQDRGCSSYRCCCWLCWKQRSNFTMYGI
jgi:hypothetical protein